MRRLKYAVVVMEGGTVHTFTPDDDVPDWAVPLINPERFEDTADPDPVPAALPVLVEAIPPVAHKRTTAKHKA